MRRGGGRLPRHLVGPLTSRADAGGSTASGRPPVADTAAHRPAPPASQSSGRSATPAPGALDRPAEPPTNPTDSIEPGAPGTRGSERTGPNRPDPRR